MNDFLFLTEGSKQFGLGHLSRCSALAEALKAESKKMISVHFLVQGDIKARRMMAGKRSFTIEFSGWHSKTANQLMAQTKPFKNVIVDSYHLSQTHYENLGSMFQKRLWMIDDDKRLKYNNAGIINPSPSGKNLRYKKSNRILTGKDYVILRPAFWPLKKKILKKNIKNIFVSLGGGSSDSTILDRLLKPIDQMPAVTIHLLGDSKVSKKGFRSEIKHYPYLSETDLKKLLDQMDLAVSACGQTLYELAKCGIPTIGISIIENQMGNVKSLTEAGFLKYICKKNDSKLTQKLTRALEELQPAAKRKTFSRAGQKTIDGKGARRIARVLLN